jgi:ribA/ribD-fused uncharacterized protein
MTCPIIYDFGKATPHFFLSNFYPVPITMTTVLPNGGKAIQTFASVECAYQAAKTLDMGEREAFQRPGLHAGTAKKMGQLVTLRKDWESSKVATMVSLLEIKFRHPHLRQLLLDTVPKMLVEGNYWHDVFWGVCFCSKHQGDGVNRLGKLLMNLRRDLQQNPAASESLQSVGT